MVAIIPNRAELKGKIVSLTKESGREGFHKLSVLPVGVTFLKGETVLSELAAKNEVNVLVTSETVKNKKIKKGLMISCIIRKAAGMDYFIIPDSLRIMPGDEPVEH